MVFGYSWSTLLWHRCYYPHRSRDALSPVCRIFLHVLIKRNSIKYPCYYHHCFGHLTTWKLVGDQVFDYIKNVPTWKLVSTELLLIAILYDPNNINSIDSKLAQPTSQWSCYFTHRSVGTRNLFTRSCSLFQRGRTKSASQSEAKMVISTFQDKETLSIRYLWYLCYLWYLWYL